MKPLKPKRCKHCKEVFTPDRPLQSCCSVPCAIAHGQKSRAKAEAIAARADRKLIRIRKEAIKTVPQLKKALGIAFRAWVRARDEGNSCISCDTILIKLGRLGGDYDAGHYRSVGSAKHLEFDERNVHGQCKHCNDALKGNSQGYRPRLIKKIGLEAVEALESDQEPRKYSKDKLREMTALYVAKLKELRKWH